MLGSLRLEKPLRKIREMTRPAVVFSVRAISFAACNTSVSISSVVLIKVMLLHQCIRCQLIAFRPLLRSKEPTAYEDGTGVEDKSLFSANPRTGSDLIF